MIWPTTLAAIGVVLVVAGLLAWLVSPLAALGFMVLALTAGACVNAWSLHRLYRWAEAPTGRDVPVAPLFWGRLFDRIARFAQGEADARRALSRDAATARAIVDWLPDALVLISPRNHIEWHNRAAESVFGFLAVKRPLQQFVREPEFVSYLREGDFERPLQIELSARPGLVHEVRLHLLEDERRLLICRDITEQARLNRMRSDFVANVSHEIRTPVTVIGGFAETMLDLDLDDEQRRQYLQNIVRQSQTMQRLLADLLTLATLESVSEDEPEEIIDLGSLFEQLGAEGRALSSRAQSLEIVPPLTLGLLGRQTEIESAVRNLLANAIRYTPEGGTI